MSSKKEIVKVAYLGPPGTFTEEALNKVSAGVSIEKVALPTVEEIAQAVQGKAVDIGVVPLENSIEGSVNATVDYLVFESEAKIVGEIIYDIHHCLIASEGAELSSIRQIYSHPHALAQCRKFIASTFSKGVRIVAANSTAEAVLEASKAGSQAAAIGTRAAAELYGMRVLLDNIEDFEYNQTRFAVLGDGVGKRSGHDKTSIACYLLHDRPGSLYEMLQEFAMRQINLTKIESRPLKKALGQYVFLIDMEGHVDDDVVRDAIKSLESKTDKVKLLGSFPRDIKDLRVVI